MSINIQAKTNYSFLFSSLGGSSSGGTNLNWLSDYASIKNGSYGKLMKAYYSQNSDDSVKKLAQNTVNKNKNASALTSEETKAYTKVQSTTDDLKESADALLVNGSKSLFAKKDITTKDENGLETTQKGYDVDKIYSAVSSFVNNYNSVIKAAGDVDNNSINNRVDSMMNASASNKNMLAKIGITINKDNSLSIDKDTFMKADMNKVKTLFNDTGSYGYSVSASASMINYNADYAMSKANTYTMNGSYNNAYNAGNLFNNYF